MRSADCGGLLIVVVWQLHDPRDYSAREEEVALLKDLKKVLQLIAIQV